MDPSTETIRRFGPFRLDVAANRLSRDGLPLKVHAQPLRLLALLTERAGEIVSRDEIRARIWDETTHLDFDASINACVRQVRAVLGDVADAPQFVETVPRQGYRFVAEVGTGSLQRSRSRARWLVATLVLAAAATLGVAVPRFTSGRPAVTPARPVLAILPFEPLGDLPDAWFGDALTEELIAELGRRYADQLAVVARTSAMQYKRTTKSVRVIAQELGCDYVLEGSVRARGSRLRITAQLIDARDDSHLWANNYERSPGDLVDVQVELGDAIAQALGVHLVEAPPPRPAAGPELWQEYHASVAVLRRGDLAALHEAHERLSALTAAQPTFAPAYVEQSMAGLRIDPSNAGIERARRALQKALALDDELAGAHLALANLRFYRDYDLEGARSAFERALAINPNYAEAHHAFAAYWSVTGNHDRAIAAMREARRLDPRSSMVNSDVGWYYYFARRYHEAIVHSERTLELDPDFYWARLCILLASIQAGDLERARVRAVAFMSDREGAAEQLADVRDLPVRAALEAHWRWRLARMRNVADQWYVSPADFSQLHIALGDHEAALEALESGFEQRSGWILPFLAVDPWFDPLRDDPRFHDLLARVRARNPES